ncbi:MazG nucleotide pyrophosphohydrolase domain protein [Microbacterium foliorum]|uniref:MazG nucleotide pyrophosphohydrolase domain protein n=1 Tax=Microbacterium foliorum TaxID=104336 RepID=A0A0F0KYV6_9MICO|nr:MazG nucleotide pyrophosphohydrolase domain protein [Microbacterium foliorum]
MVSYEDREERVTRYFHYLAHELREAGLADDSDRMMSAALRENWLEEPALRSILANGMRAGVEMAFTVAYEKRVFEFSLGDKESPLGETERANLDELYSSYASLVRSESVRDFDDEDVTARFDALFAELEGVLGARTLIELLGATELRSVSLIPRATVSSLRAFVAEREWDQFHTPENLAKSISIEAGELLESYQWGAEPDQGHVEEELADVVTYCIHLANKLGVDLEEIVMAKLQKTAAKYPVELAKGRMTKYTEL